MRTFWITSLAALLLVGCAPDPETIRSSKPAAHDPAADSEDPAEVGGDEQEDAPPLEEVEDEARPEPEATGDPVKGIDVSHFQGDVDWSKVKAAGVQFAFVKATEGVIEVDPKFASNWDAMKEAGLVRGAYARYAVGEDPAKQAAHFLATVRLESGDLPPVVDVETLNRGQEATPALAAGLHTYLAAIEAATSVKAIVYTSPGFWDAHFDDTFGAYPLWVAEYGTEEPKAVKGWDGWTFWQHGQGGAVDGVTGKVDLDSFAEPLSSLRGLALP